VTKIEVLLVDRLIVPMARDQLHPAVTAIELWPSASRAAADAVDERLSSPMHPRQQLIDARRLELVALAR
jgi:hypothetical protein